MHFNSQQSNSHTFYRACYSDGVLIAPKPGQTSDPKPTAGNDGTTIIVRTLIYDLDKLTNPCPDRGLVL